MFHRALSELQAAVLPHADVGHAIQDPKNCCHRAPNRTLRELRVLDLSRPRWPAYWDCGPLYWQSLPHAQARCQCSTKATLWGPGRLYEVFQTLVVRLQRILRALEPNVRGPVPEETKLT